MSRYGKAKGKIAKVGGGLRATFVFSVLPAPRSKLKIVWLFNGSKAAQIVRSRGPTVVSLISALGGLPHGVWAAIVIVDPPGRDPAKAVARASKRI